jgi:glycosyltransferase involved in cell wall biosynthesis
VLTQNRATAALLGRPDAVVLPNVVATRLDMPRTHGERDGGIVVVGRLVAWKAGVLAVEALARLANRQARLTFLGTGPERGRITAVARRHGVAHRVDFAGSVARDTVVHRVATAGVLLHPSLHEEAGMAVAEALSLGTPVVCLDHGGPAELLRWWPAQPATAVAPAGVDATAQALAQAVDSWLRRPPPVAARVTAPVRDYAGILLDAYERAAGATAP